jgi:hypothetical protein
MISTGSSKRSRLSSRPTATSYGHGWLAATVGSIVQAGLVPGGQVGSRGDALPDLERAVGLGGLVGLAVWQVRRAGRVARMTSQRRTRSFALSDGCRAPWTPGAVRRAQIGGRRAAGAERQWWRVPLQPDLVAAQRLAARRHVTGRRRGWSRQLAAGRWSVMTVDTGELHGRRPHPSGHRAAAG